MISLLSVYVNEADGTPSERAAVTIVEVCVCFDERVRALRAWSNAASASREIGSFESGFFAGFAVFEGGSCDFAPILKEYEGGGRWTKAWALKHLRKEE